MTVMETGALGLPYGGHWRMNGTVRRCGLSVPNCSSSVNLSCSRSARTNWATIPASWASRIVQRQ